MGKVLGVLLLIVGVSPGLADEKKTAPPACQDEEAMVADYQQGLTELVATVQKESLADFERTFHRKSCLTKLTLCDGILDTGTACFDKALQESKPSKDQAGAYKAKREAYAKLKERISQYRDSLKATEQGKAAKAMIEKFDLAN